ncbi:MAG: hypothetical protein R3D43_02750 [Tepidamorphaceae bacterium]
MKSEREIAKIRHICGIASGVFENIKSVVWPGKALSAVFRDFQAALLHDGADWVPYVAWRCRAERLWRCHFAGKR